MSTMFKCKYAGDPNDEYCKTCDGFTMMVDGKEIGCQECAGYEEGEKVAAVEEPKEEVKEPAKKDPKKVDKKKPVKTASQDSEGAPKTTADTEPEQIIAETEKTLKTPNKSADNGVSTITLRFMSGATVERGGTYYKFECCEERKLPEGLTEEQVADEREKLWALINSEIDKQIADVTK